METSWGAGDHSPLLLVQYQVPWPLSHYYAPHISPQGGAIYSASVVPGDHAGLMQVPEMCRDRLAVLGMSSRAEGLISSRQYSLGTVQSATIIGLFFAMEIFISAVCVVA